MIYLQHGNLNLSAILAAICLLAAFIVWWFYESKEDEQRPSRAEE